jgi:hypothetical protein
MEAIEIAKSYDDLDVLRELRLIDIEMNAPPENGKSHLAMTPRFISKIPGGHAASDIPIIDRLSEQ